MRYGFLNNFSQALAADLAAGATTMTLDGGGSLLADAKTYNIFTLTLFDEDGNLEVVHVTNGGSNSLTVTRGEEGTTDQAWPAGTSVEMRLTAATLSGFPWGLPSSDIHYRAVSIQPERASADRVASGYSSVAIGDNSMADGDNALACGESSRATGSYSVALGADSITEDYYSVAVGWAAYAGFTNSSALGRNSRSESEGSTILGANALGDGSSAHGVAVGEYANISGLGSIAIGNYSSTFTDGQVAIGPNAYPGPVQSAMDVSAIPVMGDTVRGAENYQHDTAMRVTLPTLLRTKNVSLASTGDKDSIDLPASTMVMIDRIEALVISSAESGSTPTISIGTTLGGSEILSGHVMAGDTVLSREQLVSAPLDNAVTALYFKVDTAAAAAMEVRFVVHGYVMEV